MNTKSVIQFKADDTSNVRKSAKHILSALPDIKKSNNRGSEEATHHEPPHLDLRCLQF